MSLWVLLLLSCYSYIILIYLLPYIHIGVYTTIHIYAWRAIYLPDLPAVLVLHSLISIFPFPFLISTSLFIHLQSSIDFYFAKVSKAGNTANTETSPIDGKLFMTLRNQRLRFPENFYRPIVCLMSPACDVTLHIKGSR